MSEQAAGAHQWRGVIEEYRDRLPVTRQTPVVTLCEGGTPLVESPWLSGVTGSSVWLKVEGSNPTGSFKDRGMTVAMSIAAARAPRPPSAPPPATPRRRWRPTPPAQA
jgi:threonine synthase